MERMIFLVKKMSNLQVGYLFTIVECMQGWLHKHIFFITAVTLQEDYNSVIKNVWFHLKIKSNNFSNIFG